jgi:hypothetical protein
MFTSIIPYVMPSSYGILNSTMLFSVDNIIPAAELIILISLRCICSVSSLWDKSLKDSLNMGITSLSLTFIWIITYNILTIMLNFDRFRY